MLCWVPRCEETKFLCAVCMCFIQCCLLQEVLTEHVCAIGVQWGFNVVGGMTNISLGINYKYNGLLYHNIDRVWVVTKVILPKLEDISFPDVKFNADYSFVNKICNAHPSVKTIIQSMCKSLKLLITLIKQKEKFYEMAIQSILKEEIPRSLRGKGNSQLGSSNQDPVSAGERFLHSTKGEMPLPVHRKKAIAAFLPAIAGLAKIAVESLSTFLQ